MLISQQAKWSCSNFETAHEIFPPLAEKKVWLKKKFLFHLSGLISEPKCVLLTSDDWIYIN